MSFPANYIPSVTSYEPPPPPYTPNADRVNNQQQTSPNNTGQSAEPNQIEEEALPARIPIRDGFPKEKLFRAIKDAKQPTTGNKVGAGVGTAAVLPYIFLKGMFLTGPLKGAVYGAATGAVVGCGVGAIPGAFIGAAGGAVVQPVLDVKAGVTVARRLMGRYSHVNNGLSVKADSLQYVVGQIFSSIPTERISIDPTNEHTIVTIKATDKPGLKLSSNSAGVPDSRFDEQGNRHVDVDALIERLAGYKENLGPKFAIKATDSIKVRDELGEKVPSDQLKLMSPTLCNSKTDKRLRTSIYVQNNIKDAKKAETAGLQLVYELDRMEEKMAKKMAKKTDDEMAEDMLILEIESSIAIEGAPTSSRAA